MILAAFFIFAALGQLALDPWDYFEYEPPSVDELAEEAAWIANEREQDAQLDDDEAWAIPDGRFL